jgi:hypothetical protein
METDFGNCLLNPFCKERVKELIDSFALFSTERKAKREISYNESINTPLMFKGEELELFSVSPLDKEIIDKTYDLLSKFFVKGELVTKAAIVRNLYGLSKKFKPRPKYRLFCVKNSANDIIGARIMEQIPFLDSKTENVLYAVYIALDKRYQGSTGVAKQLYISSLIDAVIEAEKNQKKLRLIVAECSDATENLQNSVGLKRVYFKKEKVLRELNFKQPYMKFDTMTGKPIQKDEGENKEHFMIGIFEKKEISKDDLYNGIVSLFNQYESNKIDLDFCNFKSYSNYKNYFQSLKGDITKEIFDNGELVLMSKKERLIYQLENGDDSVISHKDDEEIS